MTTSATMTEAAAQPADIPADARDTSGWWLLPALIAGAGIWAALAWWCPVAAGLLLAACGAAVVVRA